MVPGYECLSTMTVVTCTQCLLSSNCASWRSVFCGNGTQVGSDPRTAEIGEETRPRIDYWRNIAITLIDRVNEWLDYRLLKYARPMTNAEKDRLSAVIRATEYLFLENIALKLVLEHRAVPNWQRLLERLLDDKEMLAGVRLKFRDLYGQLAGTAEPSGALDALLAELPAPKKPH